MEPRKRVSALAGIPFVVLGASLLGAGNVRAADPTLQDCIQANENALNLQRDGKLRQARSQWSVCTSQSCGPEMIKACQKRIEEVNTSIPTVVFDVTDATGKTLTAVKVSMDGQPVVDRLEGTAVSLDPGKHVLTFEVAGQAPVQKEMELLEGSKDQRVAIIIGAGAPSAAPSPAASPSPATSTEGNAAGPDGSPSTANGSGWSTQRWMALGLAGVGLVGVVVGAVEGLSANSSWNDSKNECSQTNCPATSRPQALSDHDSATSAATISTVSFAIGGAALVGGVVWFLLAPAHSTSAEGAAPAAAFDLVPALGPGGGGMTLRGSF